jgi:hypothetical protein
MRELNKFTRLVSERRAFNIRLPIKPVCVYSTPTGVVPRTSCFLSSPVNGDGSHSGWSKMDGRCVSKHGRENGQENVHTSESVSNDEVRSLLQHISSYSTV